MENTNLTPAEKIVNDILFWDDPEHIISILTDMMINAFLYYDEMTPQYKNDIVSTYNVIADSLRAMKKIPKVFPAEFYQIAGKSL